MFQGSTPFVDHLCYFGFVCVCHIVLPVLATLWSPAGPGPTSCLSCMLFSCVFVTFPYGVLGQVWYLIVLIPDLCLLPYSVLYHMFESK